MGDERSRGVATNQSGCAAASGSPASTKNGAIHTPACSPCAVRLEATPSMPEGNFALAVQSPQPFSQPSSICTVFGASPGSAPASAAALASTFCSVTPSNSVFQLFQPTGTKGSSSRGLRRATASP